jgi:hypothetical protein
VSTTDFQSRYVAYAKAHGKAPAEMLAADKEALPGGCMARFMVWIGERWTEWCREFKRDRYMLSEQDHADFDAWLKAYEMSRRQLEVL